jgi:DNA topoisomerase-2
MEEFFVIRLEFYHKRKDYLLSKLERELSVLSNKCRFIM